MNVKPELIRKVEERLCQQRDRHPVDPTDTKRIIRKFLNSLMPINLTAYFHGMNILLERHILPKLSQQETDNLDSSLSVKEIKL